MVLFPMSKERTLNIISLLSFLISLSFVLIILIFLIGNSIPVFKQQGLKFLIGTTWHSTQGYGALPMIYCTVLVTFLAICIALPLGLGSAIIISEILTGRLRLVVKGIIELLAGIPGIVYGILGVFILAPIIKQTFGLIDGSTIFTAGTILSIMILPTLMTLTEDALRSVPNKYREQAAALGLNRREVIIHTVFPAAIKGIVAALLLSISRAMATTVAVMMVIGSVDRIPRPVYNIFTPGQTITSKLGREAADAVGGGLSWNALVGLGLILFIIVMLLTFIADIIITSPKTDKSLAQ